MKKTLTVSSADIIEAGRNLRGVITRTPLIKSETLSKRFNCEVYLKREDLQVVRSYKIRGAYNHISKLSPEIKAKGVVCASAGNHAQGVAYACKKLQMFATIFMPTTTPKQKINKVKMFGENFVDVRLEGDTYDDSSHLAHAFCEEKGLAYVHPFDDTDIIAGQGTVGLEIIEDFQAMFSDSPDASIDYLFVPIGGGGLASGTGTYFKEVSPHTKVIGVGPKGAPAMHTALAKGEVTALTKIDTFVDGAAVKKVGDLTFQMCQKILSDFILVPEGHICTTILKLYNEDAIVVEPAGALAIASLLYYADKIVGKKVVCVVSGSNNDSDRMQEIKERSLIHEGLKRYFIINFPQRAGALKEFVNEVLGPDDDITRFEYVKKSFRENGPALIGIEIKSPDDYAPLIARMEKKSIGHKALTEEDALYQFFYL
jgi:threonine dehydratase